MLDRIPQIPFSKSPLASPLRSTPRRRRTASSHTNLLTLFLARRLGQVMSPPVFGRRRRPARYKRRDRRIEKKTFFILPDVRQVYPQMSLSGHHRHHRSTNRGSCLLGGPEGKICGTAKHCVQGSTSLTCCRLCPTIQARSLS